MVLNLKKSAHGMAIIVSLVMLSVVIPFFVFIMIVVLPIKGKPEIESDFMDNRDELVMVADFLANNGYKKLYVYTDDVKLFAGIGNGRRYFVGDGADAFNAMERLLKRRGYLNINKFDNIVSFSRWRKMEKSVGLLCLTKGTMPDISALEQSLTFLMEIEPLSTPGWYYYKTDYNAFRLQKSR
jgi:hypothetical protein